APQWCRASLVSRLLRDALRVGPALLEAFDPRGQVLVDGLEFLGQPAPVRIQAKDLSAVGAGGRGHVEVLADPFDLLAPPPKEHEPLGVGHESTMRRIR